MMQKFIMLFLVFCATTGSHASIVIKDFSESFSETVKVSGTFLLGFQHYGQHDFGSLQVNFPENSTGTLCVLFSSIDGKYKATLKHQLDVPVSGWTKLDFQSKYIKKLNQYSANEIAVLASLGAECVGKKRQLLVSSWSNGVGESQLMLLIRSSARKDTVHAPSIENSSQQFKCKKIRGAYTATFDKVCDLSGIELTTLKQLEVERKNFRAIEHERILIAQ